MSHDVLSSLPLQLLLYFNGWYDMVYIAVSACVFVYKASSLPYPPGRLEWEVTFIVFFSAIEACRIFLLTKGNKTEQIGPLVWSLALSIAIGILCLYYIDGQTYVLRLDVILNSIALVFLGLELCFGTLTAMRFYRHGID